MSIDAAIDGFLAAIASLGLPAPAAPEDLTALDEIDATVAPLRVPAAVRRFWQRVDPATLSVRTYPELQGPDFARKIWVQGREVSGAMQPTALLEVGYSSHQCMSVELDQPDATGGALFEWNLVDEGFTRRFNGLEDWLRYLSGLLTTGRFRDEDGPHGRSVCVPAPEDWQAEPGWRPALEPHPLYGTVTYIERDVLEWPDRWQRLAGVTPETVEPRGRTHTIAELTVTDPQQPVEATILAEVVSLAGSAAGSTVRVDDGTGTFVVWCPESASRLGPGLGRWFEFDVVVPAGPRLVPVDPSTVGNTESDPVDRVTARMVAQYAQPAGAVATAIRRADAARQG